MPAGCVIGVDLGGTKLLAGTVDAKLEVHRRVRRTVDSPAAAAVVDLIVDAVRTVAEAAPTEIAAVGVGVPALVDPASGIAWDSNHLDLVEVPLRDLLAERLGLPVVVDNDANLALVAESRHGAARGAAHAVLLTVGTGVGGAVLVGGDLLRGKRGGAGELGHIVIDGDGPPCPGHCSNRGCLEAFVSGDAMGAEGRRAALSAPRSALGRAQAAGRKITGALVTELAHDGDAVALDIMTRMGGHLGVGLVSLINTFDPEVVVVGGGAMAAGELLLGPARAVVAERALPVNRRDARIVAARFGDEAGMLGAAQSALDAAGVASA